MTENRNSMFYQIQNLNYFDIIEFLTQDHKLAENLLYNFNLIKDRDIAPFNSNLLQLIVLYQIKVNIIQTGLSRCRDPIR